MKHPLISLAVAIVALASSCSENVLEPIVSPDTQTDPPAEEEFSFDPEHMFLSISPNPVHVELRGSIKVNAVVINNDNESVVNPFVFWKVKDGAMASITNDGELTGIIVGKTTLTATYLKDNSIKAEVPLYIEPSLEKVSFTTKRINTRVAGEKLELSTHLQTEPADAYRGGIQWKVGDKNVAKVDENGVVTFLQEGVTTVTALAVNGKGVTISKDDITVALLRPVPDGYVDLGLTSGTLWAVDDDPVWYIWEDAHAKYGDQIPTEDDWEELFRECQYKPYNVLHGWFASQEELEKAIEEMPELEIMPDLIEWYTEMSVDYSNFYWTLHFVGPNGNKLNLKHRPVYRTDWGKTWDQHNDLFYTGRVAVRHSSRYVNPELMISFWMNIARTPPSSAPNIFGWNNWYCMNFHKDTNNFTTNHGDSKNVKGGMYKSYVRPILR